MRRVVIDRRDEYANVRLETNRLASELKESMPDIVQDSGGSINNLPVKTPEFQQWLQLHRDANPFIGRHVTSAPEYNVSQTDLGLSETKESENEHAELLHKIENYISITGLEESLIDGTEAPKANANQDKKFIDILLVESAAKRLLTQGNDEIKEHSISLMRSYHNQSDYTTEIDLDMIVERSKLIAIESKKVEKKSIKSY